MKIPSPTEDGLLGLETFGSGEVEASASDFEGE